jgi:ABC-type bacteriocin/lantibiotic exporter with double-glycine peptidase domain
VADIVLAVGSALVLVVGGRHVLTGVLTTGQLPVVLAYLRDLYLPVRGLTRLSAVQAGARASRVRDVLECDEVVVDWAGARPAPALRQDVPFEKVAFSYEAGHPAAPLVIPPH